MFLLFLPCHTPEPGSPCRSPAEHAPTFVLCIHALDFWAVPFILFSGAPMALSLFPFSFLPLVAVQPPRQFRSFNTVDIASSRRQRECASGQPRALAKILKNQKITQKLLMILGYSLPLPGSLFETLPIYPTTLACLFDFYS